MCVCIKICFQLICECCNFKILILRNQALWFDWQLSSVIITVSKWQRAWRYTRTWPLSLFAALDPCRKDETSVNLSWSGSTNIEGYKSALHPVSWNPNHEQPCGKTKIHQIKDFWGYVKTPSFFVMVKLGYETSFFFCTKNVTRVGNLKKILWLIYPKFI